MTRKALLILAFVACCGFSAAGQVTDTCMLTKKDHRAPALSKAAVLSVRPVSLQTVYYNHLGFMCRQELKLEKATKTSVRIRLGSVEYTDQMEGKVKPVIR